MITNLFSIFDPASSIVSNWVSIFLVLIVMPQIYWFIQAKTTLPILAIKNKLHQEFKTLIKKSSLGLRRLFIIIFFIIILNNSLGLLPYTFTATSHLVTSLTMSLPIWISLMLYGWVNHTKHILTHLVPQRTPPVLIPFMVLIETISNMIRPLTLAVRLTANIIAGHLLITLLGNQITELASSVFSPLVLITQLTLLTLELAVAVIQSYVFTILVTLYTREIYVN